jgi:hypothetical protein
MAELDAAVLAYLRRRGYAGTTLEALKKDPKMTSAAAPVADLGSNPSLQNRILFYSTEEAHPRRYFDSYLRLRDWVHSSLDLYKVRSPTAGYTSAGTATLIADLCSARTTPGAPLRTHPHDVSSGTLSLEATIPFL